MPKLPILMYHSVTTLPEKSKGLTIDVKTFEAQLQYLQFKGYTTLHFKDIEALKSVTDFPKKAIVITFDDVYVNQLELAYPLLKAYNMKACFYIPFKYVGGINDWDKGNESIMSVEQLKSLDTNIVELGLHSYAHNNYKQMSTEAIQQDFDNCSAFLKENNLEVHRTLAYPYGKYPKKGEVKSTFFKTLENNTITYGLRIGNRVNTFPFKNNYEIQRIDIKGEDSLAKFKAKLRFGKLKLF